ncbi:AraC family transcriptional regulator ligand-binding domain-containing protein [Halioxenophilus aromaticivorans]|uniref:HTH-type transcriptional regulator AraC-type N-terminal domain-containing protein n=1 Tax=Halioxenophilus aromaticivorans TaxID=1306992 RepID=A0AAV3TZ64_9ALTE
MTKLVSQDQDLLNAVKLATDELGINLGEAAMKAGLPPDLLGNAELFIPSQLFNCVLEAIAQDFRSPDLAVVIARHLASPSLGLPTRIMGLSRNLADALDISTQYGAFYRDTGHWQHQIGQQQLVLFKRNNNYQKHFQQRNLLGTAQMHCLLGQWLGCEYAPNKISLGISNPHPKAEEALQDFFACELEYEAERDAFYLPEDSLQQAISTSNGELLQGVIAHVHGLQEEITKGSDVVAQTRLVINQRLSFASCTLDDLAFYLKTTPEVLTRALAQHKLSFEEILEQQIAEKAHYYLTDLHAPIELIVEALMSNNPQRLNELLMASLDEQRQW